MRYTQSMTERPSMKTLSISLFVSAIGLAFILASPAEAAKSSKHKNQAAVHAKKHRQIATAGTGYPGGVLAGPLYNGQDYLGDDPDPNVRAFLIKNLSGRYGSSF
jgi:hypothetical protein